MKQRMIRSGTSNYWKGNSEYGFPLVIYEAENYVYDEETDSDTDERDYDADQWEYEDAIREAGILADKYGIEVNPGKSKDYPTGPFVVRMCDGYYTGLQIQVDDYEPDGILIAEDEEEYERLSEDYPYDHVYRRSEIDAEAEEWYEKIMAWMKELCRKYGWEAIGVVGHFSNGEGVYEKSHIFDSRRSFRRGRSPLKSAVKNGSEWIWVGYDVWGNEEDGWEVNNIYRYTDNPIYINDDASSLEILRVLSAEGIFGINEIGRIEVDWNAYPDYIEFYETFSDKPLGRIEHPY